jgi:hypothetical protein
MTIQHRDIPDAERHEPKGVSTALENTVYTSDGAGSGNWEAVQTVGQSSALLGQVAKSNGNGTVSWKYAPEGWAHYRGTGGQVFGVTPSKVLIDGAIASSTSAYLPYEIRGVGELFDVATSTMTPISVGDTYDVRIDLRVTAKTGTPTEVNLILDIGGAVGVTIPVVSTFRRTARTVPFENDIAFPIFCLDTFVANGGQFFLATDSGTITCGEFSLTLVRNVSGTF